MMLAPLSLRTTHLLSVTLCFLLFLFGESLCLAEDNNGCVTCHQYPGLVTTEKSRFKALHIDVQAFKKSAHGKFGCKRCHADIVQVPHTGQKSVQCFTTDCHTRGKESARIENFSPEKMHEEEQSIIVELQDDSSCRTCHAMYPHRKNNMVRALLNMHTGYMTCEVCHLERNLMGGARYQWKEPEAVTYRGRAFGSLYHTDRGVGKATGDLISRLAVFAAGNNTLRILDHHQDTGEAIQFLDKEKKMASSTKESRLKYFHRNIFRKGIRVACKECHSPDGVLNFEKLGFDKKHRIALTSLDLAGLVSHYNVFYLPDLFGH